MKKECVFFLHSAFIFHNKLVPTYIQSSRQMNVQLNENVELAH